MFLNHLVIHMDLIDTLHPFVLILGLMFLNDLIQDMCKRSTMRFCLPKLPVRSSCYGANLRPLYLAGSYHVFA